MRKSPPWPKEVRRASETRVLARLRLAWLHPGAPRLDGAGGPQARPRVGGAGPRQLLRRRRDRRAQPGAGGHAQRPHVRDGPGRGRRRRHDEHLLHLPGRAERVPGAPGRRRRLSQARELAPQGREPELRARPRLVEQELPLAAGGGDRTPDARREGGPAPRGPANRPVLRLLHRPPHVTAGLSPPPRARPLPRAGDRCAGSRARGVRGQPQMLRLPADHDEPRDLAAPGRAPPRRRHRRRRGLPGHPVPAVPPQPGPAAARGGSVRGARPRRARAAPAADGGPRPWPGAEGAGHGQARGEDGRGAAQGGGAGGGLTTGSEILVLHSLLRCYTAAPCRLTGLATPSPRATTWSRRSMTLLSGGPRTAGLARGCSCGWPARAIEPSKPKETPRSRLAAPPSEPPAEL